MGGGSGGWLGDGSVGTSVYLGEADHLGSAIPALLWRGGRWKWKAHPAAPGPVSLDMEHSRAIETLSPNNVGSDD